MPAVNEDRLVFLNKQFIATIDTQDCHGVQRFIAPTLKELCEKLIEAQEHATRKISELLKENRQYRLNATRRVRLNIRRPGA